MFIRTLRVMLFSFGLILITGLGYPLVITGISQMVFPVQANGSLIEQNGKVIGSSLIAQNFTGPGYFHPRPSLAGAGYDGASSGSSNLSVTNKALSDTVGQRVTAQKRLNGESTVPADLVTASGSGLDPHITPESAFYQAERVAAARNMTLTDMQALIERMTEKPTFGVLGMPRVNVLAINRELDKIGGP